MPSVPEYRRSVRKTGIPSAYLTNPTNIDTFGGAQAKAIGNVANLTQQITTDLIDRENDTRIKEADIRYMNAAREILENPETGFYTKKGGAAVDGFGAVQEQLNQLQNDVIDSAGNPVQRAQLENILGRRNNQNQTNVNRHTSGEQAKWEIATSEARASATVSDAISNRHDPAAVRVAIATGLDEMGVTGQLRGESAEVTAQKKEIYTTQVHKAIVNSHLETGDVVAARKYFDENKTHVKGTPHKILPQELANIEGAIKAHEVKASEQVETDRIVSTIDDPAKQLEAARKLKPEIRDEVVNRVKTRQAENKALKRDAEIAVETKVWDQLFEVPSFNSIPATGISASAEASMRQYITNRLNGQQILHNKFVDTELTYLAANDPVAYSNVNINEHINELSNSAYNTHRNRIAGIKDAVRKGEDPNGGDGLYTLQTDLQAAKDQLKLLGINPNGKAGSTDAESSADYIEDFNRAVRTFQLENGGREPNGLEKDEIRADLSFKVIERGFFFDSDEPAFSVEVEGVPPTAVPHVVQLLRRSDPTIEISDEDITSMYQSLLRKQATRTLQSETSTTQSTSEGGINPFAVPTM